MCCENSDNPFSVRIVVVEDTPPPAQEKKQDDTIYCHLCERWHRDQYSCDELPV